MELLMQYGERGMRVNRRNRVYRADQLERLKSVYIASGHADPVGYIVKCSYTLHTPSWEEIEEQQHEVDDEA